VIGVTGAGKTSFIELCTGEVKVDQDGSQHTRNIGECTFMSTPTMRVHLIDTPGLDTSHNVLQGIWRWLPREYGRGTLLSGIIYLHPLHYNGTQAPAKRNLSMFRKLCGPDCFGHIVLATTKWDAEKPGQGELRELELRRQFWGHMLENGSLMWRH
ncbi:P-loop containing nucleoside triphosphate hydrolase protein, partial [Phaeosphaeriaceae sp. PMI808]